MSGSIILTQAGCLGGFDKTDGAVDAVDATARFARTLTPQSPFTRNSADATAVRLKTLFPKLNVYTNVYGIPGEGNVPSPAARALSDAFTSRSRPTTTLALTALQRILELKNDTCNVPTDLTRNRLFDEGAGSDTVWMPGEIPPADPVTRYLVTAARRAWLYPVLETDEEIPILRDVRAAVLANAGTELQAKIAICRTVVLSPHFWLGVPRPDSAIARMAPELGRRTPTATEYADIQAGRLTLAAFIKNLQSEPGYLSSMVEWHRQWLDFQKNPIYHNTADTPVLNGPGQDSDATGPQNLFFPLARLPLTLSNGSTIQALVALPYSQTRTLTDFLMEGCEPKVQEFNPVTSRMVFEVWSASQNKWISLGEQTKNASGVWVNGAGTFPANSTGAFLPGFDANPATAPSRPLELNDIAAVSGSGAVPYSAAASSPEFKAYLAWTSQTLANIDSFEFVGAGASGTTSVLSGRRFLRGNLRVRRFGSNGVEQSGYSPVRTWWSHETVYVCNNLSRVMTTCAFRPQAGVSALGGSSASFMGTVRQPGYNYLNHGEEYAANASIVDSYRCGVPDYNEIAMGFGNSGYSEDRAYPKTAPYNDLAYNMLVYRRNTTANAVDSTELTALRQISEDVGLEPERLIRKILTEGRDYRELLTANYSLARKPAQFYYQTQGIPMATVPPVLTGPTPDDVDYMTAPAEMFSTDNFATLSPEVLRRNMPANGGFAYGTNLMFYFYRSMGYLGLKLNAITPRPMSGILTQAAFVAPMYPKVRSLSARLFARVLCRLPSSIPLSTGQARLHRDYIAKNPLHLDEKKGCYACHIQLDPAGKALSKFFLEQADTEAPSAYPYASGPEMSPGDRRTGFWGVRGSSEPAAISEGAVLGEKVRGVKELGRVLADSREFASCAVLQAFRNVTGREEGITDLELINGLTDRFMKNGYDYNQLILELTQGEEFKDAK